LTWDPDLYDGVKQIVLSPAQIWIPDIGIQNRSTSYHAIAKVYFTVSVNVCLDIQRKRQYELEMYRISGSGSGWPDIRPVLFKSGSGQNCTNLSVPDITAG